MTNEQVMKIMEDLGLHDTGIEDWVPDNAWVKVANIVAAAEREACANVAAWILKMPENDVSTAIRARGQG
jgi:hypothetical protein